MNEPLPIKSIDASVDRILALIGKSPDSAYREILDKLGGSVVQLLFSSKDFLGKQSFDSTEVLRCLDLIIAGEIKILLHPYGETVRYNPKFLIVANVNKMPESLMLNALLQDNTYSVQAFQNLILIKNI